MPIQKTKNLRTQNRINCGTKFATLMNAGYALRRHFVPCLNTDALHRPAFPKRKGEQYITMPSTRAKITVRPTAGEHELLKNRTADFGYKSLSKYLIDRGLSKGVQIENIDNAKLDKLLFEIRKLGININQIALQLNKGYQNYSHHHLDKTFIELNRILKLLLGE